MDSSTVVLAQNCARWRTGIGLLFCLGLSVSFRAAAIEPTPASWFPEQPDTPRFDWTYQACEGCRAMTPRPEWLAMARLSGLDQVRFLLAPDETNGPAYSFAPNVIVLAPSALKLQPCHLSFLVGHELVHIAQRHFDEDAITAVVIAGKQQDWTRSGAKAMQLLDDNFPLALKMSGVWQQQEREADWVGALLAAQACRCTLEQSALSYLRKDAGYGGGIAAAHEDSAMRVRFLESFADSAKRLIAMQHKQRTDPANLNFTSGGYSPEGMP
jgi:hypothetical protein